MSGLTLSLSLRCPVGLLLLTFSSVFVPSTLFSEPEFVFETGTPPWKDERLVLPPDFAPDLDWTGVEHIRFAPGMFEAGEPDFFSYILVFLLETGSDVSKEGLESGMLFYYSGLSKAVMAGKNLTVESAGFTVSLKQEAEIAGAPESATGVVSWSGTLDWI